METRSCPTAYPETHVALGKTLHDAAFNAASFRRPLAKCEISSCHGMCCYDGVYVNAEEERVLQKIAKDATSFFASVGAPVPSDPIVDASWKGVLRGRKTAVVPNDFRERVAGYPAHFDSTACVFLTPDGRCSLQLLAEKERKDRWFYKPIACVMHPIRLSAENKTIDLPDTKTDPYRSPEYSGYATATQCGACQQTGTPAFEVLRCELEYLSKIVGRDLLSEISPSQSS